MTEVNRERVALLVAALRSGEYAKATGKLHRTGTDGYPEGWCCLGVASDVANRNGLDLRREPSLLYGSCEAFDGEVAYLPESVADWYGFESNPLLKTPAGRDSASSLNDTGYEDPATGEPVEVSLARMADFFEGTFLKEKT